MGEAPATPQGFDPAGLSKAAAILEGVVDNGDLSGAVTLIWRAGEVVQTTACGRADIEAARPMARDTLFRIASMTKPVTSVAALMLVEEGRLSLDDPISRWAPEFVGPRVLRNADGPLEDNYPALREITIEDLLTHRAGLAYAFASVGPIAQAYEVALGDVVDPVMAPEAWMRALGGLPLAYPPGERFNYSQATDVLGFVVGRAAGMDFRRFLIERIFQPLGMGDTDFYVPPRKRDRAAALYRQDDETGALHAVPFRPLDAPPAFCSGGAGLISTADDYLKFARMLLGGGAADGVQLLEPETVAMMRTNRLTDAQRGVDFLGMPFWLGQGFGLGLSVITDPRRHAWMGAGSKGAFGWPGAFGTWWQADPVLDMIAIYLTQNAMPMGPEAVANMGQAQRLGARLALPLWQKQVYAAFGK